MRALKTTLWGGVRRTASELAGAAATPRGAGPDRAERSTGVSTARG
jgi:hypothetical protein